MVKYLAILAVLLSVAQAPVQAPGQASNRPGANGQNPASAVHAGKNPAVADPSAMGSQDTGTPSPKAESDESVGEHGQPIIVTLPATPPAPWTLREKISWGASLVLVILGYAGVMLALRTLKIIQRQTESNEAAAQAALDSAHAALLNAQSIIGAERPWLLISIEPFLTMENCFKVMVTNRGRTPARIVALADRMRIAKDETHLPASPAYDGEESGGRPVPIILLPGESTGIRRVSRDDVKRMCKSDESLRRVEQWEDKLFVYGKVTYRDLIAPADKQIHETDWCCWFIYREAQCNLVSAGPPDYNRHT
jgi:antitoxin (DNA-binding transcriptional repressor) of toxin-antitoxin stability system